MNRYRVQERGKVPQSISLGCSMIGEIHAF
jgi:hypothetical protein